MRFIPLGFYILVFWVAIGVVRLLTLVLRLLRFDRTAAVFRERCGRPRVLYLAAFFPGNAGYEERVRSWSEILREIGFDTEVRWCFRQRRFEDLLRSRRIVRFQLMFLVKRLWHCLEAPWFDAVIVRRELLLYNDYGGLFLERFLLALNSNVALDFDDDIAVAKGEPRAIRVFGRLMLESGSKFRDSIRLYRHFIVGSSYLASMVRGSNGIPDPADITVVPTCVDLARYPVKRYGGCEGDGCITFGWIGSVGNLKYLDLVLPALEVISREHPLKLIVISGKVFERRASFEVVNVPWSYATQGDNLNLVDIGLMPLHDGPEEWGKCGFKLIQYMACGIVSVASAVTTNVEIIEPGVNGFLVRPEGDWGEILREVLSQKERFEEIGRRAREAVAARYSFDAHRVKYAEFVARLCSRDTGLSFGSRGRPLGENARPMDSKGDFAARRY